MICFGLKCRAVGSPMAKNGYTGLRSDVSLSRTGRMPALPGKSAHEMKLFTLNRYNRVLFLPCALDRRFNGCKTNQLLAGSKVHIALPQYFLIHTYFHIRISRLLVYSNGGNRCGKETLRGPAWIRYFDGSHPRSGLNKDFGRQHMLRSNSQRFHQLLTSPYPGTDMQLVYELRAGMRAEASEVSP